MKNRDIVRIVFCGTPEFAIPSLEALYTCSWCDLVCVVTGRDKPKGRGLKLQSPPVKVRAEELGLRVFQPERIRSSDSIDYIKSLNPDVLVVVAYGQFIPRDLLYSFRLGAVNVHPSLLPKYRGAAPIQRAILAGEDRTGVTVMLIDDGMDSGPILAMEKVEIGHCESAGALHDRLAHMGAELLVKTLEEWSVGEVVPIPQDDALATYALPIQRNETIIDWNNSAAFVSRQIRAYDPFPGAVTFWKGRRLKCFGTSRPKIVPVTDRPGKVIEVNSSYALIQAGDGAAVPVGFFQLEGRRCLRVDEFIRGVPNFVGSVLGVSGIKGVGKREYDDRG